MCVLGMTCGFTSCEEELDPWEIVELEADCSQEEALPYDGGTFIVNVNANTAWTVITPEWMSADKTSGTGQGTVNVTVEENTGDNQRNGFVRITAGSSEPDGNIVGQTSQSFNITQQAKYEDLKISNVNVNLNKKRSSGRDDYYDYYGTVTYTVETRLTNEEIEELFPSPDAWLNLYGYSPLFDNPAQGWGISTIDKVSLAKGTHTITFDSKNIYGNFTRCDLYIAGSRNQNIYFTTNRPYIIN